MNDNYLVLSRKWRPQSFDDVIGQLHVTKTLQNALKQNRLGHGYLFTGSRGVGKTSVARILSRAVNCPTPNGCNPCNTCSLCIDILNGNNFDVIELDGASNRGIDEIRDLRESVKYPPITGKYKTYIIDEAHMLTREAFNALLKTLEEPPKHVLFVLSTTDPHKIPQTILSRTQRFNFKRISINEIINHLSKVLKHEKILFDESCLKLISKKADGSMRDALSLLDQVIAYCDDSIDAKNVSEAIGLIDNSIYSQILFFILKSDLANMLTMINNSIDSGYSINDFTDGFIDFLNRCMHFYLNKTLEDDIFFDDDVKSFLRKIESDLDINIIIQILELTIRFQNKLKFVSQPMISLESHFVNLAYINKNSNVDISSDEEVLEQLKKNNSDGLKTENNIKPEENLSKTINNPTIDEGIISAKKNDQENQTNNNEEKKHKDIQIKDIKSNWEAIVNSIEEKNPKTASFISKAVIANFKDKKLTLVILNGSQFHINSLENDIDIINETCSELLKEKINVYFESKVDNSKNKNNNDKPKQHPLLNKTIDLLDGEII